MLLPPQRSIGVSTQIQLITEEQAAERIGFSTSTLRHWRCSGVGPSYVKIRGGRIRYRHIDLDEWIDSHLVEPEGERGAA